MNGKEPPISRPFRRREVRYPERVIQILKEIWDAAQFPWSVRMKGVVKVWMPWIKRRWQLSVKEEALLLAISPATIDRRLKSHKNTLRRRIYGKTKPGHWLRKTIPIQTESWDISEPGWLEIDTVSHSGPNASGLFASTLNEVDIFSGWTETCAVLGKSAQAVVDASEKIHSKLPFDLKGTDSDNGDEFINYAMDHYCRKNKILRFRSRPNKKDDQAHIEQKNGTHVRRLMGWERYDTLEAVAAMNDLYRNEWRLLANIFLPSVKLANKIRIGSRIKRVYRPAQTPLDRLWDSQKGNRAMLEELRRLRKTIDPFELSKTVDLKLEKIWSLASRGPIRPSPTPHATKKNRPWEAWLKSEDSKFPPVRYFPDAGLAGIRHRHWKDSFFGSN